jgi:transposase-like protein
VDRGRETIQKESFAVPKSKPPYSEEFKRDVLAYQASTGKTNKEVAAHFGLNRNSLRVWKWRAQAPLGAPEPAISGESLEAEVRRLRFENRDLQMRCEILKKTVHIFSDPSGSGSD